MFSRIWILETDLNEDFLPVVLLNCTHELVQELSIFLNRNNNQRKTHREKKNKSQLVTSLKMEGGTKREKVPRNKCKTLNLPSCPLLPKPNVELVI